MKRLLSSAFLLALSLMGFAQINGIGYYRVKNTLTEHYMYVMDNTGSLNISAADAEMGAMQLYKGLDKAITNPASVIYFSRVSTVSSKEFSCNFAAQGVDVYGLIGYYVNVYKENSGHYQVYASSNGLTKYLDDNGENSEVPTYLGYYHSVSTTHKASRSWDVIPINNSTDNYVAIKPTFTINGKYYAPYYAAYSFSLSSGMKAYVVTKIDAEKKLAVYAEIPQGQVIPAATPVLIECSSTDVSKNKINLFDPKTGAKPAANILKGVYFCNDFRPKSKDAHTLYNANTMRVFGTTASGKIGFVNSTKNLHIDDYVTSGWDDPDGKYYLNANQCYLPVPTGTPNELTLISEEDYKAMTAPAVTPGDINGDNKLNANDLMLLLNHTLGNSTLKGDALKAADLNGDGKITANDLMLLVNKIL